MAGRKPLVRTFKFESISLIVAILAFRGGASKIRVGTSFAIICNPPLKDTLTELEPYCKRLVQVSKSEAETIKDIDIELGHHYFDIINNKEMLKFHIDYWEQNKAPPSPTPVTPTTSIRVSSRATPLIIVGQDKSVFAQYLLGSKTWTGPAGQRLLLPKSEGDSYMVFVNREFGFVRVRTEAELVRINTERHGIGRTYMDTQAELKIHGTTNKQAFTELLLVTYLYIGANNEGYRNIFHMSLQFEDVVDCLQVLYPDYEFVFIRS